MNYVLSCSVQFAFLSNETDPVFIRMFRFSRISCVPSLVVHCELFFFVVSEIQVDMQDSIVWSKQSLLIQVIPSPLVSVIRGGAQRYANRNETIIMNGIFSYDPDFPGDKNLV